MKWRGPDFPGGRILAVSGDVEIGAVFPPAPRGKWRWRMWVGGTVVGPNGQVRTEKQAKAALADAWAQFLARAGLADVGGTAE